MFSQQYLNLRTFLRVDVENFGCRCTGYVHESFLGHDSGMYSFLPNDRHPVLQSVDTIGDFCKVILAHGFLAAVECAVVGSGTLQLS